MDLKIGMAGLAGIGIFVACGGSSYKLGGNTQANENAGGSGEVATGGGPAESAGGSANDAGSYGGRAGGSYGGDPSAGGVSYGGYGAYPDTGGVSFGGSAGDPGAAGIPGAGGVSYGGQAATGGDWGAGGVTFGGQAGAWNAGGALSAAGGVTASGGYGQQSDAGISVGPSAGNFIGNWVGYVENQKFTSGSDALAMSITAQSTTAADGTITLGQASSIPTPAEFLAGQAYISGFGTPVEGYAYTAMNGAISGTRLSFDVAPNEIWNPYCAARTPIAGTSSCVPGGGAYSDDGRGHCWAGNPQTPVDCTELSFCLSVCRCDDSHCFADTSVGLIHFDMALRAPYIDGSMDGVNGLHNVHFTSQ